MSPHLTDWTPDHAQATAFAGGVRNMGEQHWRAITSCRELTLRSGSLPSLDELVAFSGLTDEQLRRLFGDVHSLLPAIAGLSGCLPESLP